MSTGRRAVSLWQFVCVACLVLPLAGCGAKKGQISGNVTYDGKPLKRGKINFHPSGKGKPATAEIEDGEFSVKDAPLEKGVKVTVITGYLQGAQGDINQIEQSIKQDEFAISKLPPGTDPPPDLAKSLEEKKERLKRLKADQAAYIKLPAKYEKPETTPLSFDLGKGDKIEVKVEKD